MRYSLWSHACHFKLTPDRLPCHLTLNFSEIRNSAFQRESLQLCHHREVTSWNVSPTRWGCPSVTYNRGISARGFTFHDENSVNQVVILFKMSLTTGVWCKLALFGALLWIFTTAETWVADLWWSEWGWYVEVTLCRCESVTRCLYRPRCYFIDCNWWISLISKSPCLLPYLISCSIFRYAISLGPDQDCDCLFWLCRLHRIRASVVLFLFAFDQVDVKPNFLPCY